MSLQQELLPRLVETCAALHPECSVVRIGSVARGKERADSDIDLNVILPGGEIPSKATAYIGDDNRWQLRLKDEVEVIRIDVAWETQNALVERLRGAAAVGCWPFSQGHVAIQTRSPGHVWNWRGNGSRAAPEFQRALRQNSWTRK